MRPSSDILRNTREDKDIKQEEIAAAIGTSQQQYSRYERGVRTMPTRMLAKLADYYGLSVDYLLGRTESTLGVQALAQPVTSDCTAGQLLSQVLALDEKGRQAVVDYVQLQGMRPQSEPTI